MSHSDPRLGIYYEHPDWYRPLFQELDRRGVPYDALHADSHHYDPSERTAPHAVVLNRMSPSAYIRWRGPRLASTSASTRPRSSRNTFRPKTDASCASRCSTGGSSTPFASTPRA